MSIDSPLRERTNLGYSMVSRHGPMRPLYCAVKRSALRIGKHHHYCEKQLLYTSQCHPTFQRLSSPATFCHAMLGAQATSKEFMPHSCIILTITHVRGDRARATHVGAGATNSDA